MYHEFSRKSDTKLQFETKLHKCVTKIAKFVTLLGTHQVTAQIYADTETAKWTASQ